MMAFFMGMWITSQSKDVKEAVAGYFNDPHLFSGNPPGGTSPVPSTRPGSIMEWKRLKQRSKDRGRGYADRGNRLTPGEDPDDEAKASMLVLHDGDQASDGTVVLFGEDSAELNDLAKRRLKQLVSCLRGKPNKIEIRGHASRRPLPPGSSFADAWDLCFARCMATMKYLEQSGLESSRMRMSQAGVFEPHTIRSEVERQALNSRVEVYALAEIAEDFVGTRAERAAQFNAPGQKQPAAAKPDTALAEAARPHPPIAPTRPEAEPAHGKASPAKSSHAKPSQEKPSHSKPSHAKKSGH